MITARSIALSIYEEARAAEQAKPAEEVGKVAVTIDEATAASVVDAVKAEAAEKGVRLDRDHAWIEAEVAARLAART